MTEVRVTDPNTGGEKGKKPEEYALIPVEALAYVARVYGFGAGKYSPHNWARGYLWSLSYSALYRHVAASQRGEWLDPESGLPHLAHVVFHCFTLMTYMDEGLGTDDRREAQDSKPKPHKEVPERTQFFPHIPGGMLWEKGD